MSAPPASESEPTQPVRRKEEDGFWASLSPADQKKYTLVFLVSLGTTLLVTGRSGGSLLKRAKKSEASAPPPIASIPLKKPQPSVSPSAPTPSGPTPPKLAPTSSLLEAPPTSFLHPNSLSIPSSRSRKRLLPSFVNQPSSTSSRSPSSYFLPNTLLTSHSTAYAKELDRQDKLHEDGTTPLEEQEPEPIEDGFNPAIYAAKALGIATAITFTTFGLGIWGIMKWLGVDDMDSLSLALTHRLGDKLKANRPNLPSWVLPSSTPPTPFKDDETERQSLRSREDQAVEDEEMSYWTEVKETLDREAEERKKERRTKWETFVRSQQGGQEGTRQV